MNAHIYYDFTMFLTTYAPKGRWVWKLWCQRYFGHEYFEELIVKCRGNVVYYLRLLATVKAAEEERRLKLEMAEVVERVRKQPRLNLRFWWYPAVHAWQQLFLQDELRYPLLVSGSSERGSDTN